MNEIIKGIVTTIMNLFKIKSLVTLTLTGVFSWAVIYAMKNSTAIPSELTETFKIIVVFFFGTQVGKAAGGGGNGTN